MHVRSGPWLAVSLPHHAHRAACTTSQQSQWEDRGTWSVLDGPWSVPRGPCSMVRDPWCMCYRSRPTALGGTS